MIAALLILAFAQPASGVLQPSPVVVPALVETRVCGASARLSDGTIARSRTVTAAFQRQHPCPVNGLKVGACPGWAINHVIPLASGGCDAVSNLQWLPVQIKSCADPYCVDRWERLYWGAEHGVISKP